MIIEICIVYISCFNLFPPRAGDSTEPTALLRSVMGLNGGLSRARAPLRRRPMVRQICRFITASLACQLTISPHANLTTAYGAPNFLDVYRERRVSIYEKSASQPHDGLWYAEVTRSVLRALRVNFQIVCEPTPRRAPNTFSCYLKRRVSILASFWVLSIHVSIFSLLFSIRVGARGGGPEDSDSLSGFRYTSNIPENPPLR